MEFPADRLSDHQIADEQLADWRKLAQAIHARYLVPDLARGAAFVAAVAALPGPPPHITLTDRAVDLALATRTAGIWVTPPDIAHARDITELAAAHGLTPDPAHVTQLEVGLDTADHTRVSAFWAALLTGSSDNAVGDSVLDPGSRLPFLWWQQTEPHETPRQRWHFDLWLAPDLVDERVAVAVAAGGTVVDETHRPSFVVLADADGNRACLCTTTGRP